MIWSDDPVRDADRYFQDQDELLKRLPVCDECHEHIQGDGYYEINDYKICPDCMRDHWRWIEI